MFSFLTSAQFPTPAPPTPPLSCSPLLARRVYPNVFFSSGQLKCLYTCRQEERIRDVRCRMSQTHLHSISQMFPLRGKLWNPFRLSSHCSSSKVLLSGFMKLEGKGGCRQTVDSKSPLSEGDELAAYGPRDNIYLRKESMIEPL